jgi:hypothetical protein
MSGSGVDALDDFGTLRRVEVFALELAQDPVHAAGANLGTFRQLEGAEHVAGGGTEGVVVVDIDPRGLASEHGFKVPKASA